MSVTIHLPSILRSLYRAEAVVQVEARTVAEAAAALDARYPGLGERLLEPDGSLRRYVNVFVRRKGERWQAQADTPLAGDAEVWIVQNVAGG